jgi:hypothetical protein
LFASLCTVSGLTLGTQQAAAQFTCTGGGTETATGALALACGPNTIANGQYAVAVGSGISATRH